MTISILRNGVVTVLSGPDAAAFEASRLPQPAPIPRSITRRQFILALLNAGLISSDDALAAATSGALPAPFAALLETMSAADALAARITWAAMAVAERGSPLIAMMVAAGAATDEQVDDLFRVGATL